MFVLTCEFSVDLGLSNNSVSFELMNKKNA
jgi:hypothetical protein